MNRNPRIGVLLRLYGESRELEDVLLPFRLMGLVRFEREWPADRRARELADWNDDREQEWSALLACRQATLSP
jgi:hypothetical protein